MKESIVEFLKDGAFSLNDIADFLGVDSGDVEAELHRMELDGIVRKIKSIPMFSCLACSTRTSCNTCNPDRYALVKSD